MDNHDISPAADQDLSNIFDYTEATYGTAQAITYLEALAEIFAELGAAPEWAASAMTFVVDCAVFQRTAT